MSKYIEIDSINEFGALCVEMVEIKDDSMKLICTKYQTGLTVGSVYTKELPVSDEVIFNVCVVNDEGEYAYYPKKVFEVVDD